MAQKSVLVVEDEYIIALDLKMMLEEGGWRVLGPAATVRDALLLIEDELPSVALLDVHLGREFVTPVAEALKERGIPFALATAYHNPEEICGAALADVPSVGKPSSKRRLLAVLAEVTGL